MEVLTKCNYLEVGLREIVEHSAFLKLKVIDLIFIDMRFHTLNSVSVSDDSRIILVYPTIPDSQPYDLKRISLSLDSSLDEIIRAIANFIKYKLYRVNMSIRHTSFLRMKSMNFTKAEIITMENLLKFHSVVSIAKIEGVSVKTIYARIARMKYKMQVRSLPQLILACKSIRLP